MNNNIFPRNSWLGLQGRRNNIEVKQPEKTSKKGPTPERERKKERKEGKKEREKERNEGKERKSLTKT